MNRRSFLKLLGAALLAPELEQVGSLLLPRRTIVQVPACYGDSFAGIDRDSLTFHEALIEAYSARIEDFIYKNNPLLVMLEDGTL